MLKTFNCGVGFCIIVDKNKINKVKKNFEKKYRPYIIGKISKGRNRLRINEKINWF